MNTHIILGLFALYVAAVSLWLVLSGRHDTLLALLRQIWGRTIGHALFFVGRVALPLLICIICLGWGVRQYDVTVAFRSFEAPMQLNVEYYRDLRVLLQKNHTQDPAGIVYGA
jgi:hypothetical protein